MSQEAQKQLVELNQIMTDFYAALQDNTVERKWKKKAVNLMVEIDQMQRDLREDKSVLESDLNKLTEQAEKLFNQLNRY